MDRYVRGDREQWPPPDSHFGQALLDALALQSAIGLVALDGALRVTGSRLDPEHFNGLYVTDGARLTDLVREQDAQALAARLQRVQTTREPLIAHRQRMGGTSELAVTMTALPLAAPPGEPAPLVLALVNATKETRRLDLLFDAAAMIGSSLDVAESSQQLASALAPGLGDEATVYLVRKVYAGEEPPERVARGDQGLRCVAMAPEDGTWPEDYIRPGTDLPHMPNTSAVQRFQRGEAYILPDRAAISEAMQDDPALMRRLVPPEATAVMQCALLARGLILGGVSVWRTAESGPFTDDDLQLLQEVASRAALSIDNARRYTRERTANVTLQRALLPPAGTDTAALEAAGVYLPATSGPQGAGGDWYDVIPLSSLRVALVVGDVVGHGLRATAAMGRMRTAVQALADLDLGPGDMLTHLDDLVLRFGESTEASYEDVLASTCLYAVYDPVAARLTMASAGHPPPGIISPDGGFAFAALEPGPPLGVGGLPYEDTEVDLEPGTMLVLYTDGLVEHGHEHDLAAGMDAFARRLAALDRRADLQDTADAMARDIAPAKLTDDATLLLARVRETAPADVATWPVRDDPAAVTDARELVVGKLAEWGLPDLAFSTELMVSELVTNAIRYAGGPIELRLIRDRRGKVLVCEVSDPSNSQPRLRRARPTDEGGRGLFLIAQLAVRWGSRYNTTGKTIWAEQALES
ncbi:ATP-binding SpoIIE family protein phosphatase [Actinacidiphila bryophytorum]|uniref:ATP-binding SpoIIE family protein phosphatase n=1 Tax=Actinacidiphila bryophytorum TaxID=1436133 RepID=UPI002176A2DF|nr:SpoIIE family protein phosphatase [Actinacidiphila bryophytorum]UWE10703.1 SpoIIE family protein phosphatase [Actinacidiphila bryophytorum]